MGAQTSYTYSSANPDLLTVVTDARGRRTITNYDYPTGLAISVDADFGEVGSTSVHRIASFRYDAAGRLTSEYDALGRETQYTYTWDDLQAKASKTLATSTGSRRIVVWERNFDGRGNVTRETVGGISRTDYLYDAENRLVTQTLDPEGLKRAITTLRNSAGQVNGVLLTGGGRESRETFTLNTSGGILSRTLWDQNAAARTITYSRDAWGNAELETSARTDLTLAERITSARIDALGRVTTVIEPSRPIDTPDSAYSTAAVSMRRPQSRLGYNAFGELTETQDANGGISSFVYDQDGRPIEVTRPKRTSTDQGSSPHASSTYLRYSPDGDVIETGDETNAGSRTRARHTYDIAGNLLATERPDAGGAGSSRTTFSYDLIGQKTSSTAESGARTEFRYDSLGRMVSESLLSRVNPEQSNSATTRLVTTRTYDDAGRLTSITSPAGRKTSFALNAAGEVTSIQHPGISNLEKFEYDLRGNVVKHTDTLGAVTVNAYDDLGQKISSSRQAPDFSAVERWAFDRGGNAITHTDARGAITTSSYDAASNVRSIVTPIREDDGVVISAGYDIVGNRVRATDGNGNTTWTVYDEVGNVTKTVEPATATAPAIDQRSWSYAYDDFGNQTSERKPDGSLITRTFDARSRLIEEAAEITTRRDVRHFSYDAADRLIAGNTNTTTTSFAWNDRDLPASSNQDGRTTALGYDADGLLTSRANSDGSADITFILDGAGRQQSATYVGGTVSTTYEPTAGLKTSESWSNGGTHKYYYDGIGRLNKKEARGTDGVINAWVSYKFDVNNNITEKQTNSDPLLKYKYDDSNRLTESLHDYGDTFGTLTTRYEWDAANNLIKRGYVESDAGWKWSFDERNRISGSQGYPAYPTESWATYQFDAAGQLRKQTEIDHDRELGQSESVVSEWTYDGFGQLITETGGAYDYDAFGRLAKANGFAFEYSGTDRDATRAANSRLNGYETTIRGIDGRLLATRSGQTHRFTFTDLHGDLIGGLRTRDSAATMYEKTSVFNDFGGSRAIVGGDGFSAFGYQGDWTNQRSRSVNMDTRWYDPSNASFLTRDNADLGFSGPASLNRYAYASGNPVSMHDPDGRFAWFIAIPAIPAISGAAAAGAAAIATGAAAAAAATWDFTSKLPMYIAAGVMTAGVYVARAFDTTGGMYGARDVLMPARGVGSIMAYALQKILSGALELARQVGAAAASQRVGNGIVPRSSYESVSNVMADSVGRGQVSQPPPAKLFDPTRVTTTISTVGVAATGAATQEAESVSSPLASCGLGGTASTCILPTPGLIPSCASSNAGMGLCTPVEPVAGRPGAVSGVTAMSSAVTGSPGSGGPEKEPGCRPKNKPNDDAVKPYDVGTYSELKRRSRRHDQIDIHHVPQSHPASQVVPGYSRKDAPSIALPKEEHASIPTKKGSYDGTPSDLIAKDIHDLREYTQAPEDSIAALEELIEELLPDGC